MTSAEGFGLADRLRAFGIHLLASAFLLLLVLAVVIFFWYPDEYLQLQGVLHIVAVLVAVDVVLGPLLTFVVYRKGKKSLRFDLSVIVALQLGALFYGIHAIYQERPYFVVFALDSFHVIAVADVNMEYIAENDLDDKPFRSPQNIVSYMPIGDEFQRFQNSVLFEGQPDLERRPEYWAKYPANAEVVKSVGRSLDALKDARPGGQERLRKAVSKTGLEASQLVFIPIIGKKTDMAALVETRNYQLVGIAPLDPWIND